MAFIITVANNKGGVGKSTTVANLAPCLALRGKDVLVIDFDPQANLTAYLGQNPRPQVKTTFDGLQSPTPPYITPINVLQSRKKAGVLDLLPSVGDLAGVEAGLITQADRLTRIKAFTSQYLSQYDYIIIDTPPAIGNLTVGALFASDMVIITVQPEFLPVRGLVALVDVIDKLNTNGARIGRVKILFTRYDKRKSLHRLTTEQVEGAGFNCFATKIRDNITLSEAPAVGTDVLRYAPKSNGAKDYNELAGELLRQNFNIKNK